MEKENLVVLEVEGSIFLRQYSVEDASFIFQLIDSCREHLSQNGEDTASKYPTLDSVMDSIVNPKNSERLRLGIWDKRTFVGSINLTSDENRSATLGYWLGEQYQGKGYVTKAAKELIRSTFKIGKVDRIIANVARTNVGSIKIMERLGFTKTKADDQRIVFSLSRRFKVRKEVKAHVSVSQKC